jgi:serine/threonine protein phosphatase PrpC
MGAIAAIADGVSAGGLGRQAAQTTVTALLQDYFATPPSWDTTVALERIIAAQNLWLAGQNHRLQPARGLTTLTALVLRGQGFALAHVGDTRAYLVREGELTPLTQDHAMDHPDLRHQLLRAVGAEDRLLVDYIQGDLHAGDLFILLSDGVHGVVPGRRIFPLLTDNAQRSSEALVQAALAAGSRDNATALVVRVLGVQEATLDDEVRLARQLPVAPRLKVGNAVDGLTVTAIVSDNGINILYQARARAGGSLYALKTLHPQRAHDPEERSMLAHEAWLARRMGSSRAADHLVRLHEPAAEARSCYYLLYDWHGGETLQQMLDRKHRFSAHQAATVAIQAARTLGLLHRQNVIHRDVKPANLHQGDDGVLRLLDLGVALSGREPEATRQLHAGTPSYMNPEQWGYQTPGQAAGTAELVAAPDAGSDLFALGVTLYQLLTGGKLPYGEVLPYQAGRYFRDPIAPSRHRPEVPIWLDHVVLKAVARDRRQRFETAEEMLLALERGASRPLAAPSATPFIERDPAAMWKIALAVSALFNALLIYWLLFLPT